MRFRIQPQIPLIALVLLLVGCTAISVDYNPPDGVPADGQDPVLLRVCVLKDTGISCRQTDRILVALTRQMAQHGIAVSVPWIRDWQRPGFFETDISRSVAAYPLIAPCDRILTLVGRDFKDFAWGLFMPEILGAVELLTRTKGYVVASIGSLNQLLSFRPPAAGAIHELYHMLGCDHGLSGQTCAAKIDAIKEQARRNRKNGQDFFPGVDGAGDLLLTRTAVEAEFNPYLPQAPEAMTADLAAAPAAICL